MPLRFTRVLEPRMYDCHFAIRLDHRASRDERDRVADWLREEADALGVEKFCGIMQYLGSDVEECRRYNELLATLVDENPDLLHGWARINPEWGEAAVDEFRRAVEEDGLLGLKLTYEVKFDDPRVEPLAEAAIDMDVPIKIHTLHRVDPPHPDYPNETYTENVLAMAQRYPELKVLASHIGGGGDWEYRIKNIRNQDNVYLDISGTGCEAGMVEMAAEYLGVDRLVYGSDNQHLPCVGKLESADLSPEEKARIATNMSTLLAPGDPHRYDPAELEARRDRLAERFARDPSSDRAPVVDANAFVGHWPYRELDASVETLLERMDEAGVDRSIVSSIESVTYRNPQPGNRRLAGAIEGHEDRFVPFATVNPTYPAWDEDLAECVEEFGMRGVTLLPGYHDYELSDPAVERFMRACADRDLPVLFCAALEDQRQRHPTTKLEGVAKDRFDDEAIRNLITLLHDVPETDVVVADAWTGAADVAAETRSSGKPWLGRRDRAGETLFVLGDCYMYYVRQGRDIVDEIGVDNLVLGPQLPFKYAESYVNPLDHLPIDDDERRQIARENLLSLVR